MLPALNRPITFKLVDLQFYELGEPPQTFITTLITVDFGKSQLSLPGICTVGESRFETAAKNAPQFQKRLMALSDHPLVGEARGMGLVGAIELAAHKPSKKPFDAQRGLGARVVANAQAEGLIVRFIAGDVISICPPLIIKPAEIDELFEKLTRALDKTLDWAKREQLLAA